VYDPGGELHLRWDDPAIGIIWPEGNRLLSDKDRNGKNLADVETSLPRYTASAPLPNNC
jgi:dTDP-4-dehydrorhamnose 3,5-epimerase